MLSVSAGKHFYSKGYGRCLAFLSLGIVISGCTNPGARLPGQGPLPSEAPRQSFAPLNDVESENSPRLANLFRGEDAGEAEIGARSKFSPAAYGVKSSPRVSTKRNLRKGGGRYQVGKPYTIRGRRYVPREDPNYRAVGLGSWYGPNFHGRLTANGEIYDQYSLSAAHPTMPLPSYARVTNMANGKSVIVRVNDRGPFSKGRIIDLSARAAQLLDYEHRGVAKVKVEYVGKARMDGEDGDYLLASYRQGGSLQPRVQLASNSTEKRDAPSPRSVKANLPGVAVPTTALKGSSSPSSIEDRMGIPRPIEGLSSFAANRNMPSNSQMAISSILEPLIAPEQGMADLTQVSFGPFHKSSDFTIAENLLAKEGLVLRADGDMLVLTVPTEDAVEALSRLADKGYSPAR